MLITFNVYKVGLFDLLKKGVERFKSKISQLKTIVFGSKTLEETLQDLEKELLSWDVGVEVTSDFLRELKRVSISENLATSRERIIYKLKELFLQTLGQYVPVTLKSNEINVFLICGVNGTGKTSSSVKLAHLFKKDGNKVLIGGADTFRAAAIEQLKNLCEKYNVDYVTSSYQADPASVAYNALDKALSSNYNLVILDTGGRLHTKTGLMEELKKIKKVCYKKLKKEVEHTLLVLDSTYGQNAKNQAKEFNEFMNLSGVILTKLDSTSKGGFIFSIKKDLNLGVKFISFGEAIDNFSHFNPNDFVEELFN